MVRKQRVPVHKVKLALTWMREAKHKAVIILGGIKTEQVVEPAFYRVVIAVPNRFT